MNNEFQEILKKIGITKPESSVYLTLLTLQDAKARGICRETKIPSSKIYHILDSLIRKGLVNYRIQNNTKVFMASSPETLNELFFDKQKNIEEERKQINELVNKLKVKKVGGNLQSNYKYYEGISGIKAMWHEINSLLDKNSIELIYGANKQAFEKLIGFYDEHHKIRNKLKAQAKILAPLGFKELARKRANRNTEIKFLQLNNEAEWGVVDDMVYLQYIITKNPRAFLIKDKIFANTMENVFYSIWKKSGAYPDNI